MRSFDELARLRILYGAMMKPNLLFCALLCVAASPVLAQTASEHESHHAASASAQSAAATTDAEVRKVDKDAGKITLKHGPIPNLEMPGMTMVFRVADPAMLDQVKAGDKVKFAAESVGGQYTVTRIEPLR